MTRTRTPTVGIMSLIATLVLLLVGTIGVTPALGVTANNFAIKAVHGDRFYNYDFTSVSPYNGSNVDWPVGLIFYYNAYDVNKVKNDLAPHFPSGGGGPMYFRFLNASGGRTGWRTDTDSGRKDALVFCTPHENRHYRIYGDDQYDRFGYNAAWGYWVAVTVHKDYYDCPGGAPGQWFGQSEAVERNHIAPAARGRYGSANVFDEQFNLNNHEPARWEGNHYWLNSGLATGVRVLS